MLILTAFLCDLFTCNRMSIMRFLAHFGLVMDSVIIFMTTPEKWLESAYIVLICGLFAVCMIGSAAADIIIRGGGFTFCFKCCLPEKPIVVLLTQSLPNSTYRSKIPIGGGIGIHPKI